MQKVVLIITDGVGYKERKDFNAFYHARKPNYDYLFEHVPNSLVATHGSDVGLPVGVMGNSEVGHLSIGSGRVLYQDLVKINNSIKDGTLSRNEVLNCAVESSDRVHLAILLSDGGVHSHIAHLFSIIDILTDKFGSSKRVFLHLITDGRDVSPGSATKYISSVLDHIGERDHISIATLAGRFFAMDRDNRWDRVEKYFLALSGQCSSDMDVLSYVENSFALSVFDEFIEPASFGFDGLKEHDAFIFLNYRSDRAREIVRVLSSKDFRGFDRRYMNLNVVCMCEYDESLGLPVIFPKDNLDNTLSEVVSRHNLRQAHIAETEKYAHVTFFFNGGREEPFENEDRYLIPSPSVKTYDLKPEMSAVEVCDRVLDCMGRGYDLIVVNFANGDMVGHTGNYEASVRAVECIDSQIGRIMRLSDSLGYALVITSDHGNCEEMMDEDLNPVTNHTVGDVFCFVKASGVTRISDGRLSNIAPTVLKIMGLPTPPCMDEALF